MGTHISRVKSVDLDSWTDEQLQSVLMWGNSRANKYWEAKLAPGHVPSEAKIENFIRTKYEAKRWVMDGPRPDPSTLDDEGDDDIPLNLVKEKQEIARANSLRGGGVASPAGPSQVRRAPQPDLYDNDSQQQRSSSGPPAARQMKADSTLPQQPKAQKPADSLLGLDFFAQDSQAAPARSSSAAPSSGVPGQSRPDLKQSILSLYASAPKSQATQNQNRGSVSSMTSGGGAQSSMGGLDDFAGLSFTSTTSPPSQSQLQGQQHNAFSSLGSLSNNRSPATSPPVQAFGGGFFDVRPQKPANQSSYSHARNQSSASGFGAFDSALSIPVTSSPAKSSGMNDLFDFAAPITTSTAPKPVTSPPSSVFNLTKAQPAPKAQATLPAASTSQWGSNFDAFGTSDAWGSVTSSPAVTHGAAPVATNDFGWGSGDTSSVTSPKMSTSSARFGQSGRGFGQTTASPQVSADEEFGGWSSAPPAPAVTQTSQPAKPAAPFAANDDLFSNVWE